VAGRADSELDPEEQAAVVAASSAQPQTSDVAPGPGTTSGAPDEGVTREIEVDRASGQFPNAWGLDEGASGERAQGSVLAPPAPERVPRVLLRLSRDVGIEMQDDQIVHAFVEAMRDLFPGRRFAVRLLAPEGDHVALFYASGRLRQGMRDPLLLEAEAAETHGLDPLDLERAGVRLTTKYVPFFEPSAEGFDVPVTDGNKLIGILSVEVPARFAVPAWDAPILVPLALEMGSKLKSARLLRESTYLRDYLAQVIERANAPIVVLRPDRCVEKVNLAFLTVTCGQREQWVGADFVALLPPVERERALAALDAARLGVATSNVELRIPRHGGGYARIVFNTAAIAAPDGEIAGIVAIGRDVTEVRDLEEQIIQAEKLATLGQLAAGVVHELNNPLTSISVYSEYLLTKGRRASADAGDLEKLGRIAEGAARMLRFTRDLVTYARPSSEEPASLSMTDVVDQALVFCDHVIAECAVTIERVYAPGLPALWAVRGQLHQVFINLITNACHAMNASRDGGQRLQIRIDRDGEAGIVVNVGDDGPGIQRDHVDHIFEPFFSTKGEGKGTGLGLSIVRNIVQQHGGTITVESTTSESAAEGAARGTTFTLRFPLRPATLLGH
jgi:two-component system NtrC family sensor kinase